MTLTAPQKVFRCALWFAPVAIVVIVFFAAMPWLKQQSDTFALALSAAAAIFVMGYAHFVANKVQRGLDEVQIASQRYAISLGFNWGPSAAVVLLLLPPVTKWLVDLANTLSTGSPETPDRGAVQLALIFGLMVVVVVQTLGVFIAGIVWWRRMVRS